MSIFGTSHKIIKGEWKMELNPNHPVTKSAHDQWHKILAVVMLKLNVTHVEITVEDVACLGDGTSAVVVQEINDVMHVRVVTMEEGRKLAKAEGGLAQ
jgi:hypothetical protein